MSSSAKKPHIALLMMVKNEEKRIHVSLESIIGIVKSMVVYDTGSTDKTLEIIKNFAEKHKIILRLKEGEFINFSESRNVSLDFADSFDDIDFLLLLDCNDELRGGDKLLKFAKDQLTTPYNAFLMCQHWWSGKYDKYFNTRFIRAHKGWRYKGSVHEWMADTSDTPGPPVYKMPDDIILFQDRTKDDDKSAKRFSRDKVLLLEDHKKDPTEPRVLFYLAQTCSCLGQNEDAFYYYKLRTEVEGFQEEKFHAYLRCGEFSERLKHDWSVSLGYYMKAVEHSPRVEPLIHISNYYNRNKKWLLAFTFANFACSLSYPTEAILFVDKHSYDYTRWHILGIVAYYCGRYKEGKIACLKAIEVGLNSELDKKNLEFYESKETEGLTTLENTVKKSDFIQNEINKMQKQDNKMPLQKMQKIATTKWKNRKK